MSLMYRSRAPDSALDQGDQALLVAEDKEFVNSWRSPKAFRASVKRIVTQLSNILEWTTGQTAAIPAWGRVGNLKHGKAKKKS